MHDLVIRHGMIVDGTGQPRYQGDVAIDDGVIAAIGLVEGHGHREINAEGLIVTPGFVDIHTHYDGQATWDSELAPSSWHGVTSVVIGNCGVGFAPVAPDQHDFLIELMEGVEDIPGTALAEGLPWDWESFPSYLDSLDRRKYTIDVGTQMPHSALRAYVMGERGADHTIEPSPVEIAEMARHTRDALLAGAIGFGTSRTLNHRSKRGQKIGSLTASQEELLGIGTALAETQRGVFQFVCDFIEPESDVDLLKRLALETGRPVSVTLAQLDLVPDRWRVILQLLRQAIAEGARLRAQIATRPIGALLGLNATFHPFVLAPTYRELETLPLRERVARMRLIEVKERILAEQGYVHGIPFLSHILKDPTRLYRLGDPADYEPDPASSIAAEAERAGVEPLAAAYDALLEDDGRALLYYPLSNFSYNNLEAVREMVEADDVTVFGLSDGGAHVGTICDASMATSNLTLWVRDRRHGQRFGLESMVKRQTSDTARHVGWHDRGLLKPGFKADINVIDFENLHLHRPHIAHDLPAGGRRLLQSASGYRYTVKAGTVTFEDGHATGELPGRLVRGAQPIPT